MRIRHRRAARYCNARALVGVLYRLPHPPCRPPPIDPLCAYKAVGADVGAAPVQMWWRDVLLSGLGDEGTAVTFRRIDALAERQPARQTCATTQTNNRRTPCGVCRASVCAPPARGRVLKLRVVSARTRETGLLTVTRAPRTALLYDTHAALLAVAVRHGRVGCCHAALSRDSGCKISSRCIAASHLARALTALRALSTSPPCARAATTPSRCPTRARCTHGAPAMRASSATGKARSKACSARGGSHSSRCPSVRRPLTSLSP